ncbi:hypothetical protein DFH29DRAFT_947805 [Suillus ampliporus]|nr:hypothetical protein DFH29DRAFT_947805 [Suillus ampliporus]
MEIEMRVVGAVQPSGSCFCLFAIQCSCSSFPAPCASLSLQRVANVLLQRMIVFSKCRLAVRVVELPTLDSSTKLRAVVVMESCSPVDARRGQGWWWWCRVVGDRIPMLTVTRACIRDDGAARQCCKPAWHLVGASKRLLGESSAISDSSERQRNSQRWCVAVYSSREAVEDCGPTTCSFGRIAYQNYGADATLPKFPHLPPLLLNDRNTGACTVSTQKKVLAPYVWHTHHL